MLLEVLPLYFLFEASVFIAAIAERRALARERTASAGAGL
jgi:Sec-independent protein secretion pathway component TatC